MMGLLLNVIVVRRKWCELARSDNKFTSCIFYPFAVLITKVEDMFSPRYSSLLHRRDPEFFAVDKNRELVKRYISKLKRKDKFNSTDITGVSSRLEDDPNYR